MTNSERRISYLNKIVEPPGEALPDSEIICRFAQKMGYKGFDYENAAAIYAEQARLTSKTNIDISGLGHDLIKENGSVQWPYKKKGKAAGTPRLFTEKAFYTSSKKAIIHAVPDEHTSERTDNDYPFILTTGRIRDQWHTMSKTGKVNRLNQHMKEAFVEINPADAKTLKLNDGDMAVISSRRGEVQIKAKITPGIKKGVIFIPMHCCKILGSDLNRANNITNNIIDPISKEPDFKYCAVNIQKYQKPRQRIIVVGAGAGAFGFVKSYRELNPDDEITIFC